MIEYSRNDRPMTGQQSALLHARLAAVLGGTQGEYRVSFGGEYPSQHAQAGQARPGFVQIVTAREVDLNSFLEGVNVLPLVADVQSAVTGQTVTFDCVHNRLLGDVAVDWFVYLNVAEIASGTKTVTGNAMASLTLVTDTPGMYIVEIRRQAREDEVDGEGQIIDNSRVHFSTGMVIVEVVEG